jgi:hypothetical protein
MITINMTTHIKINRIVMEIIIIKEIMNIHQVKCKIIGWINMQIILELQSIVTQENQICQFKITQGRLNQRQTIISRQCSMKSLLNS